MSGDKFQKLNFQMSHPVNNLRFQNDIKTNVNWRTGGERESWKFG